MGNPSGERPPSPSPLDRSTGSFNQGRPFPTTFTQAVSHKKWIAVGLTLFLILVLLIAVIILATSQPKTPQVPPCPKEQPAVDGGNDALKSEAEGPKTGQSKTRGIPHPEDNGEMDTSETKMSTETPVTTESSVVNWWDQDYESEDNDQSVDDDYEPEDHDHPVHEDHVYDEESSSTPGLDLTSTVMDSSMDSMNEVTTTVVSSSETTTMESTGNND